MPSTATGLDKQIRNEVIYSFLSKYYKDFPNLSPGQVLGLFSDSAQDYRHLFPEAELILSGLVKYAGLPEDQSSEQGASEFRRMWDEWSRIYSDDVLQPWFSALNILSIIGDDQLQSSTGKTLPSHSHHQNKRSLLLAAIVLLALAGIIFYLMSRKMPEKKSTDSKDLASLPRQAFSVEPESQPDTEALMSGEAANPFIRLPITQGENSSPPFTSSLDTERPRQDPYNDPTDRSNLGATIFPAQRESTSTRRSEVDLTRVDQLLRNGQLQKQDLLIPSADLIMPHWVQRIKVRSNVISLVLRTSEESVSSAKCKKLIRLYKEHFSSSYAANVRVALESYTIDGYLPKCDSSSL